jgi:uncharacterized protein involved in exopolysaccharide biosynthesis
MLGNTSVKGRPGTVPKLVFIVVFFPVFLLVFVSAALTTYILPRSYMSSARVKIENNSSPVQGNALWDTGYHTNDNYFVQTEFEVIQSELVLGKVVDLLNLNVEWGKKYGGGTPLKSTESMALLRARMELRPVRDTSIMEVRVFDEDPVEAAKIANAIVNAYQELHAADANSFEVQILDTAHPGDRPVRPNVPLNLAAGALVGIILGSLLGGGAALLTAWIMRRAAA